MKITGVDSLILRVPTSKPIALSYPAHDLVVAVIRTDGGLSGLGYSLVFGSSGSEAILAYVTSRLAPLLLGEDPLFVERLWEKMFRADRGIKRQGVAATRSVRSTSGSGISSARPRGCPSTSSGAR